MEIKVTGPSRVPGSSSEQVTVIEAGRKRLTLAVMNWGEASARLDNLPGIKRVEGETTAVFTKAREILQQTARRKGGRITFEIETRWPTLRSWCETTGRSLFDWEIQQETEDPQGIRARCEIQ